MNQTQKFVADRLRHLSDHELLGLPGIVILLNNTETGEQFWFTAEQRDCELARRADIAGHQA